MHRFLDCATSRDPALNYGHFRSLLPLFFFLRLKPPDLTSQTYFFFFLFLFSPIPPSLRFQLCPAVMLNESVDSVTSTSTSDVSRDTLDKLPQYPKPPPGIMTPPPPLEPVKPSASVAINPPEKLDTYTDVLQVTPSETNPPPASTSVESQRVSLDPAASSDIPVKPVVAKISQELPAKPAEALNTGKSDPHKHQAVYAERSLEDTPEPLPATGIPNANTSTRPLSSPTSTVENIDDVSRPTRPEIITASDAETGTAVGIWPADVVATLERGTETSPPAETIHGTSVGDTAPSDTAAPVSISPKPAKPVKPATDSDAGVDVEARVINPPTELNETLVPRPSILTAPLDAILEVTPSGPADPVSGSSTKILAHGASKEFEDVISPSPPPSPVVEEPLKFHRLNVSSSLGGALDSPDADLDLLLPSDIRAAAGAPGKTILKIEDSSEKAQRRAKMIADFEAAEEKRKLSEDIGPESLEGIKERIQKLSAVIQTSVEKLEGELRANGIECDTNSAHKLLALGGSKNTHTGDPSGEKISTKEVLGTFNPTNTNSIDATPASTSTYKFFVLIRNPESDHIQFSTLPSGLVSDAMIRKNTAFDSLQSLDFPEKFLPLWMVLQKGGFTVVGGEKDCLVVKVEADVAMEKQELVMKEIKLKLSPAEAVAREGWEKKRRVNQPDTVEDGSGKSSGGVERPTTVTIPISHPVVIPGATIPSHDHPESKTAFINETIEKPHPNEETQESKPQVQETKSKKKRPFRRLFWTAVWVAACTGAVNVALEEYI